MTGRDDDDTIIVIVIIIIITPVSIFSGATPSRL
jgi:hypothetical protein